MKYQNILLVVVGIVSSSTCSTVLKPSNAGSDDSLEQVSDAIMNFAEAATKLANTTGKLARSQPQLCSLQEFQLYIEALEEFIHESCVKYALKVYKATTRKALCVTFAMATAENSANAVKINPYLALVLAKIPMPALGEVQEVLTEYNSYVTATVERVNKEVCGVEKECKVKKAQSFEELQDILKAN